MSLVVIDVQRVFGDVGSPWASPGFDAIVPNVRRLAEAYGDDTVFTRFIAPDVPTGSWVPYYEQWSFALQPPDAELWDITPALASLADRQAARGHGPVSATTFSKWGPQLAGLVAPGAGQSSRMVLCGVSTDCCVLSTALQAADAGVEVLVVSDACAGVDDSSHAQALFVMSLYGPLIRVVTTDEALALLA